MIHHHPDDELLLAHAGGHLGRGPGLLIDVHLEGCAHCRARVREFETLGGVLLEASMRERGRHDLHALLVTVDKAKLRHQVRPGDKMELECQGVLVHEDGGMVRAVARVDDRVVAEAELAFAFAQVNHPKLLERRREVLNTWLTGSAVEP
jgi:hypothetical protein